MDSNEVEAALLAPALQRLREINMRTPPVHDKLKSKDQLAVIACQGLLGFAVALTLEIVQAIERARAKPGPTIPLVLK